ncbi:prepilin-type N-terminal cleavage/methylation domain-containing protein [bacterium BD-1]|uniref:prepilin-type N-terminal cleavage/methylation domain-containing protein n=1 Tax=Arenimonas sp. TaxID=1872635 RepID=UPI001E49ED41|nr:prepilin-type N-terminal cleavage/methylation domain-containing protein [Ottowia caeni]
MSRTRGFSLVEVMMATVLLAAGLALAFTALRNTTRATGAAEAESRRAEQLRAAQGFLRRQLEGALAMPVETPRAGEELVVFQAETDLLRFVAPMPGYLSRGGPYVQTFRIRRGAGGLRIEFEHQLLTPEGPVDSEREPEVLLDGLAEAAFSVRSLDDRGEPTDWQGQWDQPGQVPRLVRLQARFAEPRARWPELVVAPRLGQSPVAPAGAIPVGGPQDVDSPGEER